ncbi:MAG: DinB family protein [Acidobacteria bacterium]|nr:DinB family protein [Acidobacteriota bacterium]
MNEKAELLERFRRGPELIASLTTGAAGPELDWSPGEGHWSVRQIMCHLSDSEAAGTVRLRQVIAEDKPLIQWHDEKLWAVRTDYHRRKPSVALETFRRLRAENYDLLKELPDEAWPRVGVHAKTGEKTLLELVRMLTEQSEAYARQLRDVRAAYKVFRHQQLEAKGPNL